MNRCAKPAWDRRRAGIVAQSARLAEAARAAGVVSVRTPMSIDESETADRRHMELAVDAARESVSESNGVYPKVGAVAVLDGAVLATACRGETAPGEHAEFALLERKLSGKAIDGATIYTTIEPCTLRRPPKRTCAELLLMRGVVRVVIGMLDPSPPHRGNGVLFLQNGGAAVQFFPEDLLRNIEALNNQFTTSIDSIMPVPVLVQGVIHKREAKSEGVIIQSVVPVWRMIVRVLRDDPQVAFQLDPCKWEELVAAAFDVAGYDEVILTPRSGDHGRDVIATKHGIGAVRIIGSVKAYKPGHLVRHDDVRALLGVLSADSQASKGFVTTTSDFAPTISSDPFISPFIPYRLELVNGRELQRWFERLARE